MAGLQRVEARKWPDLRKLQVSKEKLRAKTKRQTMDEQIANLVKYVQQTGGKVIYKNG